jgi:hypothetical protein
MMREMGDMEYQIARSNGAGELRQSRAFFARLGAGKVLVLLLAAARRVMGQRVHHRRLLGKGEQKGEQEGERDTREAHGHHASASPVRRASAEDIGRKMALDMAFPPAMPGKQYQSGFPRHMPGTRLPKRLAARRVRSASLRTVSPRAGQ